MKSNSLAVPNAGSDSAPVRAFSSPPKLDRRGWIVLAALALAGVLLRLYGLGELSLAGDEETTALATRSLLDGWPPVLPGGVTYLRGLPFTVLEAVSVSLLGESEFSLRLVSALAAGLRVLGAWAVARWFLPTAGALAVAALLALAPLDIEHSRNARMYSLFAAFDVLFIAAILGLAATGRGTATGALTGALSMLTHQIGVLHAPIPLAALGSRGLARSTGFRLVALSFGVAAIYWVYDRVMNQGYGEMGAAVGDAIVRGSPLAEHLAAAQIALAGPLPVAVFVIFALRAGFCFLQLWRELSGFSRLVALGALASGLFGSMVFCTVLCLATLVFARAPLFQLGRPVYLLFAIAALCAIAWSGAVLVGGGGPVVAARFLLDFPAPNWIDFLRAMPLFTAFALLGLIVAVDLAARSDRPGLWLILIAAALTPALLSGVDRRIEGLRFHIHALVPLITLAVVGIYELARRTNGFSAALALTLAVVSVTAAQRPDLSWRILTRDHGLTDEPTATLGVAPDHRGAGSFVRERVQRSDLVVAEDVLQQFYYAGQVDYWLRIVSDADKFVVNDPESGVLRDAYIGAELMPELQLAIDRSRQQPAVDFWVITSGEAEAAPAFYRSPETHELLARWHGREVFLGADGLTRVFRLSGGQPSGLEARR